MLTYLLIQSEGIHCGWFCLVVAGEQPLSTLCSPAPPCRKGGMLPLNTIVLSHCRLTHREEGMKGKRSPSVPEHSLLYCPDLEQGNFLLSAPQLEGCAEGFLVPDVSEVLLLIILEMPRAQVREHAFQRRGRASPTVHPWRGAGSGRGLAPIVVRWGEGLLCHTRTAQRNEGAEGGWEVEPLADGSSWAYRRAGVGFGSSLLREMSVLNPGGSRG